MLSKIVLTIASVILPILWGVVVNWLFNFWQGRAAEKPNKDPIFPDYQI